MNPVNTRPMPLPFQMQGLHQMKAQVDSGKTHLVSPNWTDTLPPLLKKTLTPKASSSNTLNLMA